MFNFKKLKLDKQYDPENTSSFVGIRRNKKNELVFRLPKGFENFPENDFEETKKLFFKMYRTFRKFENDNNSLQTDKFSAGKDNIEIKGNGYRFKDKEDNDVVLYSKISLIDNLLETYQDLALDAIERRTGRNEEIDYSKIDKYLHKAIYLDRDVIHIDEMELPRHFLQYQSTTLIDLFCFILNEIEVEMEQESDKRVKELANHFKELHLTSEQSLFNEETFEVTIFCLKDALDSINKVTAYKDEEYWRLYEAIESFLYGELDMESPEEDGIFWGISNFNQIWEDMCNTYAFSEFDVMYADTNIVFNGHRVSNCSFGGHRIFKRGNIPNPFFVEFRDKKRWMRPDLIHNEIVSENAVGIIRDIKKNGKTGDKTTFILMNKSKMDLFQKIMMEIKKIISLDNNLGSYKSKLHKINNYKFVLKGYPAEEQGKIAGILSKYDQSYVLFIIDWKYMNASDFHYKALSKKKLNTDITKQLCYEISLLPRIKQSIPYMDVTVFNQFVIPEFNKESIGFFIDNEEENHYYRLKDNEIKIYKISFNKLQDIYLNHG